VLGYLGLDKRNFVLRQPVPLIERCIGPRFINGEVGHERVDMLRRILGGLAERNEESDDTGSEVLAVSTSLALLIRLSDTVNVTVPLLPYAFGGRPERCSLAALVVR